MTPQQGGQIVAWGSGNARSEWYTAANTGAVAISPGQPVARDGAGTGAILADASAMATACVGFAEDAMAALGGIGQIRTDGNLRLLDWTAATGAAALSPGALYYLDAAAPGKITTVAPAASGQIVQEIGRADSATTLAIEIEIPILIA